jgi:hypothetical protein
MLTLEEHSGPKIISNDQPHLNYLNTIIIRYAHFPHTISKLARAFIVFIVLSPYPPWLWDKGKGTEPLPPPSKGERQSWDNHHSDFLFPCWRHPNDWSSRIRWVYGADFVHWLTTSYLGPILSVFFFDSSQRVREKKKKKRWEWKKERATLGYYAGVIVDHPWGWSKWCCPSLTRCWKSIFPFSFVKSKIKTCQ